MTSITASALRDDLYNTMTRVNESCAPLHVTRTKGKGVVLIGEDEWSAIEETLYLMGVPGLAEDLIEGLHADIEDFIPADQVEW